MKIQPMAVRSRLRRITLLSATILANGLAAPADAALFKVVVTQVTDPMLAGLSIPATAPVQGMWSGVYNWPINAIALGLMINGKVVSYGTPVNTPAVQDGRTFDIWDPTQGFTASGAHTTLQGVVGVNSFCSSQAFRLDGTMMSAGGIFDAGNDKGSVVLNSSGTAITANTAKLANDRYYSTMVTLPTGKQLIMGGDYPYAIGYSDPQGSINNGLNTGMTPELYDGNQWTSLFGANSRDAFGPDNSRYWFPRAWIAPNGKVFGISSDKMWYLDPTGNGSISAMPFKAPPQSANSATAAPNTGPASTAVMYDVGKILQVGGNSMTNGDGGNLASSLATMIDISGATPIVSDTTPMTYGRAWANSTVLPTGQVAVTGGSLFNDTGGNNSVLQAEIWSPSSGQWTAVASAAIYRGYHSTVILMPNGTLLSAGGGAPGPVNNQNAEIYYPPYLFTATGGTATLAPRPSIISLSGLQLPYGQSLQFELNSQNGLSQVVLVGTSLVTHSFNSTQRRIPAGFSQSGNTVTVQGPASGSVAPPGYYQLIAIDKNGVPSPGIIVALGTTVTPPTQALAYVASTQAGTGTGTTTAGGTGTGSPSTGTTGSGSTAGTTGTGTTAGGLGTTTIPVGLALRASQSGMCLAVQAGNTNDGAPVTQQPCTGAAEQTWQVQPGNGGRTFVNAANGKCLDMTLATYPAPGSQVYTWTCTGGTNQAWNPRAAGTGSSLVSVFNPNLCVDVYGGSMAAGGGTVAWTCHGGPNQVFNPGPNRVALKASHSGQCLSIPAGNGNDGAPVTQQPCTGAAEQSWQVTIGTGGQSFVNAASGKCLDLSGFSAPGPGGQVFTWACNGGMNQAWLSRSQGGGSSLTSVFNTGLCLDVNGASTAAGAGTIAWTCQGSANQTFGALQAMPTN